MYKIEITADTLTELAGKVMSLAVKLNTSTPTLEARKAEVEKIDRMIDNAFPALAREVIEEAPAPVADAPALSFEKDVAPVVLRAVAMKGKPFVEGVMIEFGVERASQLDAARWAELIDRLESPF